MIRSNSILGVWLILGLSGCEGVPRSTVTVTDSAGVRITLTLHAPAIVAEVELQPILSLGGPDATGATQFYRVQHVHVDRQGALWVADGQSGEVRIFRPDGTHWKTIGGLGEGPGEFLQIRLLGSFRGDSVAVWDNANARLTLFDAEGEFVRTARVRTIDDPLPRAFDVFHDGSVLGQMPRVLTAASLYDGQILADTVRLVRVDLQNGTRHPQGTALGPLWLWTGRNQIPIAFTLNSSFDVYDGSVHLVAGPAFRVRVFEGGRLSEIYGVARDAREVSEADIVAYREFMEEYIPESQQSDYRSALRHPRRPTALPAYSRLIVAADGHVWAQIYSPRLLAPATWDVFSPAREWLGQVETPGGFIAMSITGEGLAGVWRDELGVEHVRVYRMRSG